MGQHISAVYFQQYVNEAKELSNLLRVVYRDANITLLLATASGAPTLVLSDYLGSVKFSVTYRKCSGYALSSPLESDHTTSKLMTYDEYAELREILLRLKNALSTGARVKAPASEGDDECSICMNSTVQVVLPCSHAFCSKCAADWTDSNPTCPCCRQPQEGGSAETQEWQLEDWGEKEQKAEFSSICVAVENFLDMLPLMPVSISETHKSVQLNSDSWKALLTLMGPIDEEHTEVETVKPNKFMGL
jgi:hypothetical protein